jgi:hypothetical protein
MSALAARGHAAAAFHLTPLECLFLLGVASLFFFLAYLVSLWCSPMTMCRRCGGTGMSGGWMFGYARRLCSKCGGHKLVPRLGTRLIDLAGAGRPYYYGPGRGSGRY